MISIQSAKSSHPYPIIRLPREFRRLAGVAATIYETTYNGALAFLVVPHRNRKGRTTDSDADIEKTSLYTAEVAGSNPAELTDFFCNPKRESWLMMSTTSKQPRDRASSSKRVCASLVSRAVVAVLSLSTVGGEMFTNDEELMRQAGNWRRKKWGSLTASVFISR
jgi:hypothetical protein